MADARQASGKMKYIALARYGSIRTIGAFSTTIKKLRFGDKCIIRSNRGTEWAEVTSEPRRTDEEPTPPRPEGTVLRRAMPKDHETQQQIEDEIQPVEFSFCARSIEKRRLPMRLASVEHLFGGEKIIFYFLAEGRVDFRELVKDLATEYRTRIEMRQIGVRDEARLLAEYEHCGRELCCRTFMKDLQPVTMRMAKLQKTTLDPTKISGRCGRLMCCLRFEDETYSELKKALPKRGTPVRLEAGDGEVVSSEVLAQTVTVELPGRGRVSVDLSEILEILPKDHAKTDRKEASRPDPNRAGRTPPGEPRKAEPSQPRAAEQEKGPQGKPGQPSEGGPKRPRRRRRSRSKNRSAEPGRTEQAARPQQPGQTERPAQPQQPREAERPAQPQQPQQQERREQPRGDGSKSRRRRRSRRKPAGDRPPQSAPQQNAPPQNTPPQSNAAAQDGPKDAPKPKPDEPQDKNEPPTDEWWEN